jgi:pre-mRNA-splicing factor ATP-dependent RNA helicase DHX15/PRP43
VLFNEFVLTTRPFIRTVSDIRPEWCVHISRSLDLAERIMCRLLEFAGMYYDLSTFPDSEAKRALERFVKKKSGKPGGERARKEEGKHKSKKQKR